MNNKVTVLVIVFLLVGGGVLLFRSKGVAPTLELIKEDGVSMDKNIAPEINPVTTGSGEGQSVVSSSGGLDASTQSVKEFSIDAVSFSFAPATITVNKGDTVKITLNNKQGRHDLKIDELNVATRQLNAGEIQTVTFVADQIGTFEYYCSVGSHRAMGMVGKLIVR
jgi:plastocyanin